MNRVMLIAHSYKIWDDTLFYASILDADTSLVAETKCRLFDG